MRKKVLQTVVAYTIAAGDRLLRRAQSIVEPGARRLTRSYALAVSRRKCGWLSLLVYRRYTFNIPACSVISMVRPERANCFRPWPPFYFLQLDQLQRRGRRVSALPPRTQARALDNRWMHLNVPGLYRRHGAGHTVAARDLALCPRHQFGPGAIMRQVCSARAASSPRFGSVGGHGSAAEPGSDGSTNGRKWPVSAWRGRRNTLRCLPSGS